MKKICATCNKEFDTVEKKQKYCSAGCSAVAQKQQIEKVCEICGSVFSVRKYRKDIARFCSQACGGKWHMQNRIMRGPSLKGNKLRQGILPTNAFVSEQVRGENNPRWVEGREFVCKGCGKSFKVKPWVIHQNGEPQFCNQKCYAKHRPTGDKHPLWVGGDTTYRGRGWLEIRIKAVERDNGTCCDCGKIIGKSIPVHHIRPFREFENHKEANILDNLVCLCQSCHMKRERKIKPLR